MTKKEAKKFKAIREGRLVKFHSSFRTYKTHAEALAAVKATGHGATIVDPSLAK
jgi:hypothetical protein